MSKPDSEKKPKRKSHAAQDIITAAEIGGTSMSPLEPFGAAIGAAMGAAEEGISMLKKKK